MSGEFPTLFEREPNVQRSPRIVPMLIALACAVVLTGGSIYGYLATCNFDSKNPPINAVFFWTATVGLIAVIVLLVILIVLVAVRIFGRKREL